MSTAESPTEAASGQGQYDGFDACGLIEERMRGKLS